MLNGKVYLVMCQCPDGPEGRRKIKRPLVCFNTEGHIKIRRILASDITLHPFGQFAFYRAKFQRLQYPLKEPSYYPCPCRLLADVSSHKNRAGFDSFNIPGDSYSVTSITEKLTNLKLPTPY